MPSQIKKNQNSKCLIISLGDPAGIGIEITLKALGSGELPSEMKPILVGCKKTVKNIYFQLNKKGIKKLPNFNNLIFEDLPLDMEITPGKPTKFSGKASFQWLTHATNLVLEKKGSALVTAPISKNHWHEAGYSYPGQTERLAEISNSNNVSMLFTAISPINGWRLNTLLATTHIPLIKVSKQLSPELLTNKLNALASFCKEYADNPVILVSGLNPHAGENGKLGAEEITWINPLLKKWQKINPDIELKGPISPDYCWIPAIKAWNNEPTIMKPNGILALYHDQGLIPVKLIALEEAVNTTLGLPFIRTSPDHGTAFDIAGKGIANFQSMLAAMKTAWDLSK